MIKKNFRKNLVKCNLILRLDDIAPNMNWELLFKTKKLFNKYNIKPIIGVIPKNEDKELKSYPECDFNFWEEIKKLQNDGWEIAIHGYQHLYDSDCKNDYLGHGGKTEFANHSFETQLNKLTLGKKIFNENSINVKTFFAPNHTFDKNTIKACKQLGINSIVDGYGITPYYEDGVVFFPQLFYRLFVIPFGFQTVQIHLNYLSKKEFIKFEKFIIKHKSKIITFAEAEKIVTNNLFQQTTKYFIENILKLKRIIYK